jgi:hypothetical protein
VPSRARVGALSVGCVGVGNQLSIDGVGDPSFETPQRFQGLLALGSLAPVVGPAVGVDAELGDGGDVDDVVDASVAGPGEPVPVLLTGGRVEWGGAGPGREPVAVGEPGDVADRRQDARCDDRADAVDGCQVRTSGRAIAFSSAVAFFIFDSTATSSVSSSAAIRRRVFPAMSRGRTEASMRVP